MSNLDDLTPLDVLVALSKNEAAWHADYNTFEDWVESEGISEDDLNDESWLSDQIDWSEIGYELRKPYVYDGIEYQCVENVGGEGQGDEAFVVISATDHDNGTRWFRKNGFYASYYGFTWEGDFKEVFARVREVIFYE